MNKPFISISNISISYKENKILESINLKVNEGDFIYLTGDTGSGKSTLLKSLYKGVEYDSGDITIGDYKLSKLRNREIPFLRRDIGIVFQDFQLLSDRNVYKNLHPDYSRYKHG